MPAGLSEQGACAPVGGASRWACVRRGRMGERPADRRSSPSTRSAPPGPCGPGSHFGKSFVMVVHPPLLRDQEAGDAPSDAASGP